MARLSPRARTILGLVTATLAAPAAVAFSGGLLLSPLDLAPNLFFAIFAALFAWPISAFVALVVGVPAVALAHRLRTRSVWVYVGFGLFAGLAGWAIDPSRKSLWPDPVIYPAGGLAASLVYWLIAERGRSKDPDAEF